VYGVFIDEAATPNKPASCPIAGHLNPTTKSDATMFITSAAAFVWANLNPTNYIGGVSFCPERDIPDLAGKVVLVTGG
jgi:hypothetical protein